MFDRTAPRHRARARARELYAVDLAVVALAHLAREEAQEARAHLDDLEALLEEEPELATELVRTLHEEAHACLREAR